MRLIKIVMLWLVLAGLCLPWLAVQAYYARPFLAATTGVVSRGAFLRRYVAFTEDFRALDAALPADSVLYVVNTRIPSYYAPRPVIFTLEDLRPGARLYRFAVEPPPPAPPSALACSQTVYENRDAVVVTYRDPLRPAERGLLRVERCEVLPYPH